MRINRSLTTAAVLLLVLVAQGFSPGCIEASAKGKKAKKAAAKQTPYPPEFFDAVKMVVNEKKYKEAFDILDRLDRSGYCRDKTHYYMGLCKHNMNQTQEAAQHYQVVYNFSKDPQLRYLAAVGYGQVAKYAKNRTYNGQGNLFARLSTGGSNAAGPWSNGGSSGGGAACGPSG